MDLETTDPKYGVVTLTGAVIGAQGGLLPHGSLVTQRRLAYQPDRQERYGGAAKEYLIIHSTKEHRSET